LHRVPSVECQIKIKENLSTRFVGPFEVLQRTRHVAYKLDLPPSLQPIHDVFHVSGLQKNILDPDYVIMYEPLQIKENLTYVEEPIRILERMEKKLRNRSISYVKVLRKHHKIAKATWEKRKCDRSAQPYFHQVSNFEDKILFKGGRM